MDRSSDIWEMVTIRADGRPGDVLARVVPIAAAAGSLARDGEPPLFVRATPAEASEAALGAALAAGAAGVLVDGGDGWDDVERVAVRLAVAEASTPGDRPGAAILAMTTSARSLLARASPPAIERLAAIGIDAAALAPPGADADAPAALATARGMTLLAAGAAGLPAFEHPAGPLLAASRAAGFAWVLLPVRETTA